MKYLWIALLALSSTSAFSQSDASSATAIESTAAAHVAKLFKRFGKLLEPTPAEQQWAEACMNNCAAAGPQIREASAAADAERAKAMNDVALQIHSEIDKYIERAVQPGHVHPILLAKYLKRVLGDATDELPSVFVLDSDHAPALIVGYTLFKGTLMGVGATSVTVRAYTQKEGAFKLVAATGEDMDGYAGISFVKLHSPVPGEFWLLLSGELTGANGPNNRMRLYAYDGTKFRTVWAPANAWGAFTIRVTNHGFTIDGEYYRENKRRHDVYLAEADGLTRFFPVNQ